MLLYLPYSTDQIVSKRKNQKLFGSGVWFFVFFFNLFILERESTYVQVGGEAEGER